MWDSYHSFVLFLTFAVADRDSHFETKDNPSKRLFSTRHYHLHYRYQVPLELWTIHLCCANIHQKFGTGIGECIFRPKLTLHFHHNLQLRCRAPYIWNHGSHSLHPTAASD